MAAKNLLRRLIILMCALLIGSSANASSELTSHVDRQLALLNSSLPHRAKASQLRSLVAGCSGSLGTGAFVGGHDNNIAPGPDTAVLGGASNEACDSWSAVAAGSTNVIFGSGVAENSFIGAGLSNVVSGGGSVIGAGYSNSVSGYYSAISAGESNIVSGGSDSLIGAGKSNSIASAYSSIDAGLSNIVSSGAQQAWIGAGQQNTVNGQYSIIGGGSLNTNSGTSAFIGAGGSNSVTGNGYAAFIGAGDYNNASGSYSSLVGGWANTATGSYATVAGGYQNQVSGEYSGVVAGNGNVASGIQSFLGGGYGNVASGKDATIPGGSSNVASGANSFAAGTKANAAASGAFAWGDDSTTNVIAATVPNEFVARAAGGFYLYSSSTLKSGVKLAAGSGSWSSLSDRAAKTQIENVDDARILAKVAAMPVSEWSYTEQGSGIRHLGPMAQDFRAAFGLGEDDRHISAVDEEGVALAAIKALQAENRAKDREITLLRDARRIDDARLSNLERQMTALVFNEHLRGELRP